MTRASLIGALTGALALAACASQPIPPPPPAPRVVTELGRNDDVAVVRVQPGEDAAALAGRVLGDRSKVWRVASLEPDGALRAGAAAAVALRPWDPGDMASGQPRSVVVLCYHRFTTDKTSRLEVSAAELEQQLRYLQANGFTVIPLRAVTGFLTGEQDLPPKPVVITIDDGYRSAYSIAYPLLKRFGAPATLFIYTDFLGSGAALTQAQIKEMTETGLITVESHSKTHSDLRLKKPRESDADYHRRLGIELAQPVEELSRITGDRPRAIAYPYGAATPDVTASTAREGFALGLTVTRGGNPNWTDPFLMRREMVYGTDTLDTFASRLAGLGGPTR